MTVRKLIAGVFLSGIFCFTALAGNVLVGQDVSTALGLKSLEARWNIGSPDSWSEAYWREFEFTRHRSIACTKAANALRMRTVLVNLKSEMFLPNRNAAIRDYVEFCLVTLESVSDPDGGYHGRHPQHSKFLLRVLNRERTDQLKKSIFLLPGITGKPCSGMIIRLPRTENQRGFLTAAHCLGSTWNEIDEGYKKRVVGLSRIIILDNIFGKRFFLKVTNTGRVHKYNPLENDIGLLLLPKEFERDIEGLPIDSRTFSPFEPIYIVGQNELLRQYRDFVSGEKKLEFPLIPQHSTTITMGALCRAHGQVGSVLLHNCQTEYGSSGGAIVTLSNKKVHVVGVHTGNNPTIGYRNLLESRDIEIVDDSRARNFGILLGTTGLAIKIEPRARSIHP